MDNLLLKDVVTWVVMVAGFALTYGRLLASQGEQDRRIDKFEKVMTSNDDGGPPFITFTTYKDIQATCQRQFDTEFGHIKEDVAGIKRTVEKGEQDREAARSEMKTNFAILQKLLGELR